MEEVEEKRLHEKKIKNRKRALIRGNHGDKSKNNLKYHDRVEGSGIMRLWGEDMFPRIIHRQTGPDAWIDRPWCGERIYIYLPPVFPSEDDLR